MSKMDGNNLFKKTIEGKGSVQRLDGQLDGTHSEDFVEQFKMLFSTEKACNQKGIIYIWSSKNKIPRVKGKSSILYIGKTKTSLKERHYQYASIEGDSYNWPRYQYIIEEYGPITVSFKTVGTDDRNLKRLEASFLKRYFEEHLEYPPLNRSKGMR